MKILAFGDLHLRITDPLGSPTSDGLNTRLLKKLSTLELVVQRAIETKLDVIVDLGDTFDSVNPGNKVRALYAKQVQTAIAAGLRWVRVLGNHETDGEYGVGVDVALLADKYEVIREPGFSRALKDVLFIPECSNEKICQALKDNPGVPVFGHFGVEGATYGGNRMAEAGISQSLFYGRGKPTFIGHIHRRQKLANDTVIYVGALCRADFGDKDIETGVVLFDTDCETWVIVDIPDTPLVEIVRTADSSSEVTLETGAIVKVLWRGSREWFKGIEHGAFEKLLYKLGAAKVFSTFENTDVVTGFDDIVSDDGQLSIETAIRDCAIRDKVPVESGLKYFEKASVSDE